MTDTSGLDPLPERRLAAILAADIAGYSRLMGQDEAATVRDLKGHQAVVLPMFAPFGGTIIDTAGDGILAQFPSVVRAVECAVAIQKLMSERNLAVPRDRRMQFRIGVNLGDVIYDGKRVYGDGVNIAARLEGIAEPGGICVSDRVQEDAAGKIGLVFEYVGEQTLKNISRPVRAYYLRPSAAAAALVRPALSLPDKPSIAVLPFENMSGDVEQDYFADGMVEDITTALSRARWLFVIARNSSFTYKGRAVDVKQVGRELGVRYVLEGSVRKAGNRLRITGQLIDASTGAHLWADRFDGELANIFDLQDQVTASVVGAIAPKLVQAEIERAKCKPTESLDAYDYFLRGMAAFHRFTKPANEEALAQFYRAIELDPNFAAACGMAARCYLQRKGFGWVTDREPEIAEASRLARRAADLGRDDAIALCAAGSALVVVVGDLEDGAALIDRSLVLNPNLAWAWHLSALAKALLGEAEAAIEHAARAMRLSPQDPQMPGMRVVTAFAHFFAGRFDEAYSWAEAAVREQPNFYMAICVAAASGGLVGKVAEAEKALSRLRQLNPALRLSNLKDLIPIRRREDFDRWAEGLRKAGLPE
ncbi:MAG: adenylate/guanylate cyclase domain-containing protein [Methylobacteriaceae bacterium]|nr:adenylate/guanylate cyclase domain-containing protein [Methylobacteriaceae bacterium]